MKVVGGGIPAVLYKTGRTATRKGFQPVKFALGKLNYICHSSLCDLLFVVGLIEGVLSVYSFQNVKGK